MVESKSGKIVSNTIINGISFVFTIAVGFILIPLFLSRIGKEAYGLYSILLILSAKGLLSFFDLGFEGALIKFLSSSLAKKNYIKTIKFLYNGLIFYMLIGLLISILFFSFSKVLIENVFKISSDLKIIGINIFELYSIQLTIQFISIALNAGLKAKEKFNLLAGINLVFIVLNLFLVYLILHNKYDLILFIVYQNILMALRTIVELIIIYWIYNVKKPFCRIDLKYILHIANYARYLFLSKIIGFVYNYIDKFLISILLPINNLANYNIMAKIPDSIRNIQSILNSTIVPIASSMHATKEKSLIQTLLTYGTRYMVIIILPIVVVSILLIKPFITTWVGPEFTFLYIATQILLINFFFTTLFSFGSTVIVGTGDIKKFLPFSAFGCFINLLLSLLLIRRFNITGIVFATTFSYMVIAIPYFYKLVREFEIAKRAIIINIIQPYFIIVVIGLVIFLIKLLLPIQPTYLSLITNGLFYALIYLVSIFFIILNKSEKSFILNYLSKSVTH